MTFANSVVLFFLIVPATLLVLAILAGARDRAKLASIVGRGLEPSLLPRHAATLRRARVFLGCSGLALAVVALAGPRWGETIEVVRQKGRDVILALDVSRSMLARDVPPDRLTRAKLLAQDFLEKMRTDRIGVVAFAGTAFLQAPLTIDYGAVAATLNAIDPSLIPRGGTNIGAAISEAIEAFGKAEGPHRLLVLISDGEELDGNALEAAKAAREAQIRIDTIGIGTAEGDLIPLPGMEGQFVRGPNGEIVRTRLEESLLRSIAEAGGGIYRRFQPDKNQAAEILEEAFGQLSEKEGESRAEKRPIERFQWPLAVAVALLVAAWLLPERLRTARSRISGLVALSLCAMTSIRAEIAKVSPEKLYAEGKFEEAAQAWAKSSTRGNAEFKRAFNRGCALYRAEKYEQAVEAFAEALQASDPHLQTSAHYNLGNSLFRKSTQEAASDQDRSSLERAIESLKDAIAQYDSALALTPNHKASSHNREVASKRLKELEEQLRKQKEQQQEQQQQKDQNQQRKDKNQQQGGQQKPEPLQNKKNKAEQGDRSGQQEQGGEKDQQKKSGRGDGEQQEENRQPSDQQSDSKNGGEQENQTEEGNCENNNRQPRPSNAEENENEENKDSPSPSNRSEKSTPPDGENNSQSPPSDVPKIERDTPLQGEIRSVDQQNQSDSQTKDQEAKPEQEEEGNEGKMSPAQARRLIESLRSEEQRVILRERVRPERPFRDW